ncbi:hypothetical protein [Teichococcus aestuarii]|uniref:hypothetical protein n=1 Tax=Teichococcus aestuarii TaxID=568898 RepID=UPI00360BB045
MGLSPRRKRLAVNVTAPGGQPPTSCRILAGQERKPAWGCRARPCRASLASRYVLKIVAKALSPALLPAPGPAAADPRSTSTFRVPSLAARALAWLVAAPIWRPAQDETLAVPLLAAASLHRIFFLLHPLFERVAHPAPGILPLRGMCISIFILKRYFEADGLGSSYFAVVITRRG